MPMSKDRVRFTLTPNMARCHSHQQLVEDTLGIPACDVKKYGDAYKPMRIVCRPSQFARFLIVRNKRGLQNGFKDLEPELFCPDMPEEVDASRNPNRYTKDLL